MKTIYFLTRPTEPFSQKKKPKKERGRVEGGRR